MSMAFSLAGPDAAEEEEFGLAEGSAAAAFFFAASAAEAVAIQTQAAVTHQLQTVLKEKMDCAHDSGAGAATGAFGFDGPFP